jgi:hypothetical protein
MDGLNRLTAAAQTFSIGAQTYRLTPLVLADYGEIENRILAQRPDPLAAIRGRRAGLPEARRRQELDEALDRLCSLRRVTLGELDRWWHTPDGLCYRLWLMLRREQSGITLEAAAGLLREADAAGRAEMVRRMADGHGWPDPWPPQLPISQDESEETPLPWYRWAVELSRAYGWCPAEIGRLTLAQMCIYLGWEGQSAWRQRLPLGQGAALCQRKRDQRRQWIDQMLGEIQAAGEPLEDRPAACTTQDGPGCRATPAPCVAWSREVSGMGPDTLRVSADAAGDHPPSSTARLRAAPSAGLPPLGSFPSAGLAPLRGFAQGAASESLQAEQIRIARDQLAEQRKTNQHLQGQPHRAAAVFEP